MPLKGLQPEFDWVKFTVENRILDTEIPYKEVIEDWQLETDKAIATEQRIYLQLARGHDKTDRFAWWSLLWLASTKASRGYCAGVDRDNAALFRDSSKKLKALHPELFAAVDVQKNIVANTDTGSFIETISSDADSAYGLNFDLLIINDFHAHKDEQFWTVLWTACGKKPGIRIWMESNALTLGSEGAHWVAKFRKWIKEEGTQLPKDDGRWWQFVPKGFLASWQKSQLRSWERTLHPSEYRRLINNEDTSGEESYVTPEQVESITILKAPTARVEGKQLVVTAVDLGLKKDTTAVASILSPPVSTGSPPKYQLLALDVFQGSSADPVQLREVENCIHQHWTRFNPRLTLVDPWNAAALVQKYPGRIAEWPFTTGHVRELTQALYRAIADKHLQLYPNAGLLHQDGEDWTLQRELINAVVKDCSYGQRVDHRSGGYSDRLMSVGMCIHFLVSEMGIPRPAKVNDQKSAESWHKTIMDGWTNVASKFLSIGGG